MNFTSCYLKLLISQSKCSGPLDFEINGANCTKQLSVIFESYLLLQKDPTKSLMHYINTTHFTLNCISGTPKTINFPFVLDGKIMVFCVPIHVCI